MKKLSFFLVLVVGLSSCGQDDVTQTDNNDNPTEVSIVGEWNGVTRHLLNIYNADTVNNNTYDISSITYSIQKDGVYKVYVGGDEAETGIYQFADDTLRVQTNVESKNYYIKSLTASEIHMENEKTTTGGGSTYYQLETQVFTR